MDVLVEEVEKLKQQAVTDPKLRNSISEVEKSLDKIVGRVGAGDIEEKKNNKDNFDDEK